jgi:hypothetical protein
LTCVLFLSPAALDSHELQAGVGMFKGHSPPSPSRINREEETAVLGKSPLSPSRDRRPWGQVPCGVCTNPGPGVALLPSRCLTWKHSDLALGSMWTPVWVLGTLQRPPGPPSLELCHLSHPCSEPVVSAIGMKSLFYSWAS